MSDYPTVKVVNGGGLFPAVPDGEYLLVPKDKIVTEFGVVGSCGFCNGSGMDPATYRPATWQEPSEAEPCPVCHGGTLVSGKRYLIVEDTDDPA